MAVRVSRPQATEDEFLEQELDTVTRTGVTLLGAQPRPQGVVLRFEIVLASGTIVLRGEGRVVGFKPDVHQGLGGLSLRFTRLDSRSKALVDRATALRDNRRPSLRSHEPSGTPPHTADPSPAPPPVAIDSAPSLTALPSLVESPEPPPALAAPPALDATDAAPASVRAAGTGARGHLTGEGREAILERLRSRAKRLDARTVESILAHKQRQ